MGEKTGIAWADATWNPWRACHKVSPGCAHCYMYRDAARFGWNPEVVTRSKSTFDAPLQWMKNGKVEPGAKVFVCSLSDFFIKEADVWRNEAWQIIRDAPFIFQICTKRPERIETCLPPDWGAGYPNVWLGVTGENQVMFDRRTAILSTIPARVHWVSIEPMLEPIAMTPEQEGGLNWIVIGGESGKDARRFDETWIDEFSGREPALFVKQMGSNPVSGKFKHPHGADISEWSPFYRRRSFPEIRE